MVFLPKEKVKNILGVAAAIGSNKEAYAICQNCLCEIDGKNCSFSITDLRLAIRYFVDLDTESSKMAFCVPSALLYNIVKDCQDETFEVLLEGKRNVRIKTQSGNFLLLGEDVRKFPELPKWKEVLPLQEISRLGLISGLKKTSFCSTQERTRYDLNVILLEATKGKLSFAATDGKRLGVALQAEPGLTVEKKACILAPLADLLCAFLSEMSDGKVAFAFDESHLFFSGRASRWEAFVRVSEAMFPPYEKVIPPSFPSIGKLDIATFLSMLKRVCLFADLKNKIVTLEIAAKQLKLSVGNDILGQGEVVLPCPESHGTEEFQGVEYTGKDIEISFNPQYLMEPLKILREQGNEFVSFKLIDKDSPLAFVIFDGNGNEYKYIVLPIRIRDVQREAQEPAESLAEDEVDDDEVDEGDSDETN